MKQIIAKHITLNIQNQNHKEKLTMFSIIVPEINEKPKPRERKRKGWSDEFTGDLTLRLM